MPTPPSAAPRRLLAHDRHFTADPLLAARPRLKIVAAVALFGVAALALVNVTGFKGAPFPFPAVAAAGCAVFAIGAALLALAGFTARVPDHALRAVVLSGVATCGVGVALVIEQAPWAVGVAIPGWSPITIWFFSVLLVLMTPVRVTVGAMVFSLALEIAAQLAFRAADGGGLPTFTDAAFDLGPSVLAIPISALVAWFMGRLQETIVKAQEMGSYELTTLLGRGGMGEVWRADHRMLRRPAAVKVIRPKTLMEPAERELAARRFTHEAQATAALKSPHTVAIYDFGTTDEGQFYYVMELLDGLDLDALVEREGAQPPERVVSILRQACHSLHEAHLAGLVHRDVKPPNLFLCRYGQDVDWIKVLDFGLAKAAQPKPGDERLTSDGSVSGTPAYMAPEQVMGWDIDGRADVYLLGCVAWFLLVGRDLFTGGVATQVMFAHVQSEPEPPSALAPHPIPKELDAIVLACLAKRPEGRPRSAVELAERLAAVPLATP
ncbi:MAG: serine/threonine protein kinase, partial [Myxococcales bacterium]|nr:serine/threonine protein kinase [Myxococcales bacterium]